jgi:uroporphyrin-III C-methyltransferase/precorrin-2 dehydrogenase/sirohydrochlorin ferrochelatase
VVGGGQVALRRVRCLVDAGAKVTVIAPEISAELAALPVAILRRRYLDGDLAGAWLAPAASHDPAVNERVAAAAEQARIWCVRADSAAESAAWTPAVVRHGDITVAVNAGGDFVSSLMVGFLWSAFSVQAAFGLSAVLFFVGAVMILQLRH